MAEMTFTEHKKRHVELHNSLDELIADWILHNKDKYPSTSLIIDLMEWSAEQKESPVPYTQHK